MKVSTRLTTLLGIEVPIIQAPIGSATTPELVAAVSNAGAMGMLALSWCDLSETRQRVRKTDELTQNTFGINLVLAWPQHERLDFAFRDVFAHILVTEKAVDVLRAVPGAPVSNGVGLVFNIKQLVGLCV